MIANEMLSKMSDLEFAALILQSKLDKLQNPNTPIASKYRCAIRSIQFLNQIEKTRMKESWSIQFWDDEGKRLLPQEVTDHELERIADLIKLGFGQGKLYDPYLRKAEDDCSN